MELFYITFGQTHIHDYQGYTLDRDIVLEIEAENLVVARSRADIMFGNKFSMLYTEIPEMKHFPRGIIRFPNYRVTHYGKSVNPEDFI